MESSESGASIYRHQPRDRDFEFAHGDESNIELITQHIETHIGPISNVFHEMISDLVHIDVHQIEPTPERNYYTLITTGMSDRPMNPPEEYAELAYSEVMICLPPDWKLDMKSLKDEKYYWPIRLLKMMARLPHEYQTWLWMMHTVPNGDPAEPYASNTNLSGVILFPPLLFDEAFHELKIDDKKTIHFHTLVPLHNDEMELKLKKGTEALYEGFEKYKVNELLNPQRKSSIHRKRGWLW